MMWSRNVPNLILFTICTLSTWILSINAFETNERSFEIDYQRDTFLKDNEPFRYIAGSLHYFRVPNEYWEDRLIKYKKAGLNTVQTYVEWSLHEPYKKIYDFEGDNDLFKFINLAAKHDLLVILRVGPYICAERDNGGLPFWIKKMNLNTKVRTSDRNFMNHVEDWFNYLMPKLRSHLYKNGGPVILIQIENEYGSYFACDFDYQIQLKKLIEKHLYNEVVLFTTDGTGDNYLKCGKIANVLPAIDFGSNVDPIKAFRILRNHLPNGPLINNEFYPGWLDHWSEKHNLVDSKSVCNTLNQILLLNASVNFYMMHGGTSFGFWAGANIDGSNYKADVTSYDYDAPINEYGNLTQKYFDIQKTISQFEPIGKITEKDLVKLFVPNPVQLKELNQNLLDIILKDQPIKSDQPQQFETLGIRFGFVAYKTTIQFRPTRPARLIVKDLKDRAYVYVDNVFQGILSRTEQIDSLSLIAKKNSELLILVENQGRVGFGSSTGETKGLSSVFLGNEKLKGYWLHYGTSNWSSIYEQMNRLEYLDDNKSSQQYRPRFFKGEFILNETPKDTLIDTTGWSKGIIWINGKNLGRYWPVIGPQITLYLPGVWLKYPDKNTIILLELEEDNCNNRKNCSIQFTDKHQIDSSVPVSNRISFRV